jgi:tripartite-type tricarboxylate transporter receptor subunit TctC
MKTRFARLACAATLLALSVSSATAQNYPARQITLVVPFAPGGPADFLGRLIGQKMGEDLGQQLVIDNRPGANTIIGAQAVAKAAPGRFRTRQHRHKPATDPRRSIPRAGEIQQSATAHPAGSSEPRRGR